MVLIPWTVDQIVDVPILQVVGESVEVQIISGRIVDRIVDVPVPQTQEQIVEIEPNIPQERMQQRTFEQIVVPSWRTVSCPLIQMLAARRHALVRDDSDENMVSSPVSKLHMLDAQEQGELSERRFRSPESRYVDWLRGRPRLAWLRVIVITVLDRWHTSF